jgi:hypothetical protein
VPQDGADVGIMVCVQFAYSFHGCKGCSMEARLGTVAVLVQRWCMSWAVSCTNICSKQCLDDYYYIAASSPTTACRSCH